MPCSIDPAIALMMLVDKTWLLMGIFFARHSPYQQNAFAFSHYAAAHWIQPQC